MNQVLEFLAENYIYVASGSLVLIIILIIIIAVGNKKKNKSESKDMVDMSNIQTGSINDVASNMNQMNNNMQPHNISEITQTIPVYNSMDGMNVQQEIGAPNIGVQEPVMEPVTPTIPVEPVPTMEPVAPTIPVEPVPTMESVAPTIPVEPVPTMEPVAPTIPVEPVPTMEPVVPTMPVEPVPTMEPVAPVKSADSVEELEMFDITDDKPKGSAVSGFSSVNIEK